MGTAPAPTEAARFVRGNRNSASQPDDFRRPAILFLRLARSPCSPNFTSVHLAVAPWVDCAPGSVSLTGFRTGWHRACTWPAL